MIRPSLHIVHIALQVLLFVSFTDMSAAAVTWPLGSHTTTARRFESGTDRLNCAVTFMAHVEAGGRGLLVPVERTYHLSSNQPHQDSSRFALDIMVSNQVITPLQRGKIEALDLKLDPRQITIISHGKVKRQSDVGDARNVLFKTLSGSALEQDSNLQVISGQLPFWGHPLALPVYAKIDGKPQETFARTRFKWQWELSKAASLSIGRMKEHFQLAIALMVLEAGELGIPLEEAFVFVHASKKENAATFWKYGFEETIYEQESPEYSRVLMASLGKLAERYGTDSILKPVYDLMIQAKVSYSVALQLYSLWQQQQFGKLDYWDESLRAAPYGGAPAWILDLSLNAEKIFASKASKGFGLSEEQTQMTVRILKQMPMVHDQTLFATPDPATSGLNDVPNGISMKRLEDTSFVAIQLSETLVQAVKTTGRFDLDYIAAFLGLMDTYRDQLIDQFGAERAEVLFRSTDFAVFLVYEAEIKIFEKTFSSLEMLSAPFSVRNQTTKKVVTFTGAVLEAHPLWSQAIKTVGKSRLQYQYHDIRRNWGFPL